MTITVIDPADIPTITDPDNFDTKADTFLSVKIPQMIEEMNEVAVAMNLLSLTSVSTSSVAIGTGSKSFTVETGKSFQPGQFIVIADSAAPTTNFMLCQIYSYDTGTGALVVTSVQYAGSGTKTSWVISFDNPGSFLGASTLTAATTLTTQTLLDIEDIPTYVREFNILFKSVSTNGTSLPIVRMGDNISFATSGYNVVAQASSAAVYTTGIVIDNDASASNKFSGLLRLRMQDSTSQIWVANGMFSIPFTTKLCFTSGLCSLAKDFTRCRVTTVGGTDQFDEGSISFSYK